MTHLETLGIFLLGAVVGAACMHYSRNKALIAAGRERERTDKAVNELAVLRIEQANNAGYIDGYNAARRDAEAEQEAELANGILIQGLKDGKRVSWSVLNR